MRSNILTAPIKITEYEDRGYSILSTKEIKGYYFVKLFCKSTRTEFILSCKNKDAGIKFFDENIDTFRKIIQNMGVSPRTRIAINVDDRSFDFTKTGYILLKSGLKSLLWGVCASLMMTLLDFELQAILYLFSCIEFICALLSGIIGLGCEVICNIPFAKRTFIVAFNEPDANGISNDFIVADYKLVKKNKT